MATVYYESENQSDPDDRLVTPKEQVNDVIEEPVGLRPRLLDEFIGQGRIKQELSIAIEAATKRGESIEHVLLYGNPGLGKTTLAHIIARELGAVIKITSGPAIERVGDLAAVLSNLQQGDVLFIDEIHRLNKAVEEVLYSAMEDSALDIIVGKGPAARTLRMPLERFSVVGATTKLNLLSAPLRDRFGHIFHLNFYGEDEMKGIVERSTKLLEVEAHNDAVLEIAKRSRCTPRVANRLLKRVRDYAQVKHDGIITTKIAADAFSLLEIDNYGLDELDRKVLMAIIDLFSGGPVGISTLAAAVAEDRDTIEQVYEPYLLQIGMLERTPQGRKATPRAYEHLGRTQK